MADRFQYFLDDFLNDQKCDQIWTLGRRIYHQNTSRNTRKYGNVLEQYYFHLWESEILKTLEGLCTWYVANFLCLETLKFEILELEIFKL